MNTAGGNDDAYPVYPREYDLQKTLDSYTPPRDPSVRDVLAQLDRIEEKIDAVALAIKRVTSWK